MQGVVSYFDSSQTIHFTAPVDLLKRLKVYLFVFELPVVVELIARLLLVELILEHVDLVVKRLKFVEE